MTRRSLTAPLFLAATLAAASVAQAQQFKTEKWNIGGDGGTDYLTAEPGTGRVFVSRGTHVMVVDGPTGKVLGDIPDTPRMHGIALAPKSGHGFTTNAGDSTVTIFDLKTLAFVKKVKIPIGGLDGIMYDETSDKVILTNHSRPIGTLTALDPKSGDIVGQVNLADNGPEGAVGNGKGWIYVNLEGANAIEVIDSKTWKSVAKWEICDGPTGIAYDKPSNRIFAGCSKESSVVDGTTGKVVAKITNGDGVDALGYDPSQKLVYIPSGAGDGPITVVHQDSPDKYTTVATVPTFKGAKTIAVDPVKHMAYVFTLERGPAPPPPAGATPPAAGRGGRGAPGPIIGAWFIAVKQ